MSSFRSTSRKLRSTGAMSFFLVLVIGASQGALAAEREQAIAISPHLDAARPSPRNSLGIDETVVRGFEMARAAERGVSVEQVRNDDRSGVELGVLAATLEGEFPDLYVQSEWRYDEYPNAQVVLAAEPPAPARQLIEALPFPVDLVIAAEGPSRWDAMEIVESMQELLADGSDQTSVGSYDPVSGVFSLTTEGPEPDELILAQVYALAGNRKVELEFGDAGARAEPAYIGGEGGLYSCTAGFVVRNGSTFGISTANHCPVPQSTFSYQGSSFWWAGSLDRA